MPLSSQNPVDRASFTTYCLRRLGKGVINIEVSNEQVNDRIDDALKFWWDYHFEGVDHTYYKYQLLQADLDNNYITLPTNIIGAIRMFPAGNAFNSQNMFNIKYQIMLNDLWTLTNVSVVPYWMAMQHLELLQEVFVGETPIRYNRHSNIFYIDMPLKDFFMVGEWLIIEAYQVVDPDVYTHAWSDRWLQAYATALIKRQWGEHLKKYTGMQTAGGIVFNGQQIFNEAVEEIAAIEHEVIHSYSIPAMDMIG